ncbi:calcium-dependent phosphotriesterase [Sparassis latifolia]
MAVVKGAASDPQHQRGSPESKNRSRTSSLFGNAGFWIATQVFAVVSVVVYTYHYDEAGIDRKSVASISKLSLPPQSVLVDPLLFAVVGNDGRFRENSFKTHFNPTSSTPPFFQIFDPAFLSILGPAPSIRAIASNPGFAFAHEAPIWVPETDEVFFSSNDGGPLGFSDIDHNNEVAKIHLNDVFDAFAASGSTTSPVNVSATRVDLPDSVQMTNGGTGPFRSALLLISSGRGPLPPSLAIVNPSYPYNATVILDNYYGRQFNSLNDVKIHPKSGNIFFTDVTYGFLNHFRPNPLMPNHVYRFNPNTGSVRVVADGFDRPNGLAFSADGSKAYIADSGAARGFLGPNQTEPATVYVFDVERGIERFHNRRVFAYVDTGVPDGVQVDKSRNVYAACSDGVHVWNEEGMLLGKFFLGTASANIAFAGKGRLVILAETEIFLAQIAADGVDVSFA